MAGQRNPLPGCGRRSPSPRRARNCPIPSAALVLAAILPANFVGAGDAPAPGSPTRPAPVESPLTPADARRAFVTDPGLLVELVAAEPLVQSPAALAWDEAGRLFVVENPGYPVGPRPGQAPPGRLVELRDTDGDGRCDTRTVFADGFGFPNGLMPWRGGWLVTDAPNLWWLADTNHDGRADVREAWFTGFATNQTTQLRACYPTFGPDGWIYVARGWSGGVVTSPKWTNLPPVDLKDGDFRFRPDGSAAESIGGNSQFGLVVDDVGRRFSVSNRNPLMHAVVTPRWWRRNPGLPFADVVQDVSPMGYEAKVSPICPDTTTAGYMAEFIGAPHAGTFTAACGIHRYHGEALPAAYQGSWFICEPAQSLVQRQVATPVGPTFHSHRVPDDRDFLASTDGWFRPVYAATGPDGALYVADLYRKVIDHPDYLPAEVRGKLDFDAGKEMGRLWRVRRDGPRPVAGTVPFSTMGPEHLAAGLASINGWVRQTAHRLLFERGGPEAWNAVARIATNGLPRPETLADWKNLRRETNEPDADAFAALGQVRRLWLLATLPAPSGVSDRARPEWALLAASFHPSPTIRETAWRIWQTRVTSPKHALPDVPYELVYAWADDPDPAVRFQFALLCGEQDDWSPIVPALVRIARRDGADRWTRAAVLSGLAGREGEFVRALLTAPVTDTPALAAFAADLARLVAGHAESPDGAAAFLLEQALEVAAPTNGTEATPGGLPAWALEALRGFGEGLRSRGGGSLAVALRAHEGPGVQAPTRQERLETRLLRLATDATSAPERRLAAIQLLGELGVPTGRDTLLALLDRGESVAIRIAGVRALALTDDPAVARRWVEPERWQSLPAPVRDAVIAALTSRAALLPALFEALERGDLPVWLVDPQRRRQLQNHSQPALRDRARKLFADAGGADRRQVLAALLPVAQRTGSGRHGHEVFLRVCATCHQLGGEGVKVGPDLTGVRNQTPEALLLHIVVPDAEIAPGYQACEVETRDGRSLTGLLVGETPETITLRRAGGEQETLGRANVVSQALGRMSLMPQELEKTMSEPELADLLAFLRGQP